MKKIVCFAVNGEELILEKVLVDYQNIPIYFLCRSERSYYIALCTDVEEPKYIVARVSMTDIYNLLHGQLQMRRIITKQKEY